MKYSVWFPEEMLVELYVLIFLCDEGGVWGLLEAMCKHRRMDVTSTSQ